MRNISAGNCSRIVCKKVNLARKIFKNSAFYVQKLFSHQCWSRGLKWLKILHHDLYSFYRYAVNVNTNVLIRIAYILSTFRWLPYKGMYFVVWCVVLCLICCVMWCVICCNVGDILIVTIHIPPSARYSCLGVLTG